MFKLSSLPPVNALINDRLLLDQRSSQLMDISHGMLIDRLM